MRVLNYAFLIVALAAAALLVFRPPLFAGEPGGRKLSADLMPDRCVRPDSDSWPTTRHRHL